jgi:hypothetical protein
VRKRDKKEASKEMVDALNRLANSIQPTDKKKKKKDKKKKKKEKKEKKKKKGK